MASIEERLDALEEENARLRNEVAALRPAPEPPLAPTPLDDRPQGATIGALSPFSAFDQPTDDELRDLYAIVTEAYPILHWQPHRLDPVDAPFACFHNAFRAVSTLRRTEAVNTRVSLGFFVDTCVSVLRGEGLGTEMRASSFVAAVLAHGDIAYQSLDRFPYDLGFGLSEHIGEANTSSAWRTVLATRKLRVPLPTPPIKPRSREIMRPAIGEWAR